MRNHILDKEYSILAVTESWLDENIDDNSLQVTDYTFLRADMTFRGEGDGLYVHKSPKFSRIVPSTDIE